jgi:hypothetical protein
MIPDLEITDIPADKHRAYNVSAKGRERRKKYLATDAGKFSQRKSYRDKPFIGVDGEGIRLPDGTFAYVYLALSTGESITNEKGLTTLEVLNFLFQYLPPSKDATAIIYGGSYDFNNWVRNIPVGKLEQLYDSSYRDSPVEFGLYKIRWGGRTFSVRNIWGRSIVVYDVIAFYQSTFIEALDKYLGDWEGRDIIEAGKAGRKEFTLEDLPRIIEYNRVELALLVELQNELRQRLDRVDLRPRKWISPGSIVSNLFARYDIKSHLAKIPDDVAEAARFAFSGGRFEHVKYGSVDNRDSYEYDMNAAYPWAMADLPSLAGGAWKHCEGDPGQFPFALYKVRILARNTFTPAPLFIRGKRGTISYPVTGVGWVWSPEMESIRYWVDRMGGQVEIFEAHVFTPANDVKPFAWIRDLYERRRELKAAGDGAEQGIKLALNACIGKLCQQVGWLPETKRYPLVIPAYHQLEYAGFVMSKVRAAMYMAALENPASVIAFETDALFVDEPLKNLTLGTGLGEWKLTTFRSLTYVQSGTYFGTTDTGEEVSKVRGFDPGTITREDVENALDKIEEKRVIRATYTRFQGLGVALQYPHLEGWLEWIPETRELKCYPIGKRIHGICGCGVWNQPLLRNYWHQTLCPVADGESEQYPVEWINPNEAMNVISQLRRLVDSQLE